MPRDVRYVLSKEAGNVMWCLVTHDGVERERFDKFIQAFVRMKDYISAGWDKVGIRNDRTGAWEFVGSKPHVVTSQTFLRRSNVKVYQNVQRGERWMLARGAGLPPLLAVVGDAVAKDLTEEQRAEAWFTADVYDSSGTSLLMQGVNIPNAAVWMSEAGYRMHIRQGTDPSASTIELPFATARIEPKS